MSTPSHRPPARLPARAGTFVDGDGCGSRRRGRPHTSTSAPVSPSSRWATGIPRRSRPRTRSSTGCGMRRISIGTSPPRRSPSACPTASAAGGTGVLLQLRSGGGRGGAEVRAQGDRQAGRRRAGGLLPRSHARRALGDRPAREAHRLRAAAPGRHFVPPNDVARSRRPSTTTPACPARAGARRGRRPAARPGFVRARAGARPAALPGRDPDRRRPHGHVLRVRAARRPARTWSRWRKGSRTGYRSAVCSWRTNPRARSSRRPRLDLRWQPRLLRRRVRRRRRDRRRAAGERPRAGRAAAGRARDAAGRVEVRGAGLLLGADTVAPAAAVAAAALDRGLVVLTAGEHVLRLAPPLVVGADDVDRAPGCAG